MKRTVIGSALLAAAFCAQAGVMDADWSCRMYSRVYDFAIEDLAKLEHREPFQRFQRRDEEWYNLLVTSVGVANDFHGLIHEAALPAHVRDLANVVACGRKHECAWASPDAVAKDTGGRVLPEGRCPH